MRSKHDGDHTQGFYANAFAVLLPRPKKDWIQSAVGPNRSTELSGTVQRSDVRFVFAIEKNPAEWNRCVNQFREDWWFAFFHICLKHKLLLKIKLNMFKHNQTWHQQRIWARNMSASKPRGTEVFLSSSMFTAYRVLHSSSGEAADIQCV